MMIQRTVSGGTAKAAAIAGNAMFIIESSDTTNAPAAASLGAIKRCYDPTVSGLDALGFTVLVLGALAGSIIGGVAGFGTGITLLPILTLLLGARTAIPVLTVTMAVGNLARVWWSRHDVNLRVVGAFLVGALPATALGAMLFAGMTRSEWARRPPASLPARGRRDRDALVHRRDHGPGGDPVLPRLRPPPGGVHRHRLRLHAGDARHARRRVRAVLPAVLGCGGARLPA